MSGKGFTFKQFEINHEACAMKVGTDGVLLGAWCECGSAQRIADIGTGTGLIALMCAQRNPSATIDAIEIDHSAAECARENVARSSWNDHIRVIETAIQDFITEERYELIV
ncbi:MAG: methyltransferase, partial [Rikenellaceae bacterium]|nr:methyltransferase [Rikenellaceae bacterium]